MTTSDPPSDPSRGETRHAETARLAEELRHAVVEEGPLGRRLSRLVQFGQLLVLGREEAARREAHAAIRAGAGLGEVLGVAELGLIAGGLPAYSLGTAIAAGLRTEAGQEGDAPVPAGGTLDAALGFRLGRAHRALREAWEARISGLRLSAPQAIIIRALAGRPGSGVRDLARHLHTDPMNAKRIADHLEERGLVASAGAEADRRRRPLRLTEAGAELSRVVEREAASWEGHLDELLGAADASTLRLLLDRLTTALAGREQMDRDRPAAAPDAAVSAGGDAADEPDRPPSPEAGWRRHRGGRGPGGEPDDALVELVTPLTPGRAADLGAGGGRNSIWLARRGWRVTAVDLSTEALGELRRAAAAEQLDIATVEADVHDFLAREGRFDLVVIANVHPLPEERARLLGEAAAALAPGGHLFVIGHHVSSLGQAGPPDPRRLYTEDALRDALPGLEVLRLEQRERHHGPAWPPLMSVMAWARRPELGLRPAPPPA